MKDNWLKDIHDRMADINIDEPDGLWDDIEASGALDRISQRNRHRHAIIAWTKRIGAAAAVIAIVLLTGTFFYKNTPDLNIPQGTSPITAYSQPVEEKKAEKHETAKLTVPAENKTAPAKTSFTAEPETTTVCPEEEEEKKITTAGNAERPSPQTDSAAPRQNTDRKTYRNLAHADAVIHTRSRSRVSVSVHSSGILGNTSNRKDFFSGTLSALGPSDDYLDGSHYLDMLILNKRQEVDTETDHHLPVRTGISVSYDITDRLAVESGLTYTYLTSDIKQTGDNYNCSGKQELHYIGIPVNIKYRIFSWKAVDLYASGGFLAEKCVSGKFNKNCSLNSNAQSTSEHLTVKPLQWSANASAGVQCNLSEAVGLYAEPGISYYFDNGSDVRTIYSDKPLNFNINVGLRFTLGNRR